MPELEVEFAWDEASLEAAFAELEAECTSILRGLTVMIWDSILVKTPQYAGGMAASWSYSIGSPEFYDRSFMIDEDALAASEKGGHWRAITPLQRGHPVAIAIANADNVGSDLRYKLGDTVFIANGVDHGEGPYSYDVETGAVRLRAVNMPGAPVSRTLDQINARFGDDITPYAAERLKTLHIGGHSADSDS